MNLKTAMAMYAGGTGSGCRGSNCGRPSSGKGSVKGVPEFDVSKYKPHKQAPIHGVNDRYDYPVMLVRLKDLKDVPNGKTAGWDKDSLKAVKMYKGQILKNKYEPIFVVNEKDGLYVSDGTHRAVAAHQLGHEWIKAYVDPGKKR